VIARTLLDCGASVAVHYHRDRDRAEALCREAGDRGARAIAVQGDITVAADVARLGEEIRARLGDPRIVVANAVIQYPWRSVLEQDLADYEGQFRSSVLQSVLLAKAFVPAMIRAGGGRFIAVSTECIGQALPTQSAYVAGKRGMDGVLRVLAREVGEHGITVNQVAPGWTVSERDRREGTERQPEYERGVPLRRRGEDQEVANAVAFLASDLAGFITGAILPVCGGSVMPVM
jgi:3-oxoacyl-[acyl-carrier protein] reductase